MQILEKCMEDMKAVYKLNEEKLGFNFRVLTEKIRVNENTKKSNWEKKRKYTGIRRNVILRYEKRQLDMQRINLINTKQFKKFTKQFTET